jgi:hypothetical protein
MRTILARWLISQAADQQKTPPAWVLRQMQRDPHLAQYDRQCHQLIARLRTDAVIWSQAGNGEDDVESSHLPRRRASHVPAIAVTMVVACLLLICVPYHGGARSISGEMSHAVVDARTQQQATEVTRFLSVQAAVFRQSWSSLRAAGDRVIQYRPRSLSPARWLSETTGQATRSAGQAAGRTMAVFADALTASQLELRQSLIPWLQSLDGILPPATADAAEQTPRPE